VRQAAIEYFDRFWPLLMVALVPLFVYLNFDALHMQGIYPAYVCFRSVILAGADPGASSCQSPTFPIWGYGFLLLVTQNKVALLVFQNLLAIFAAWFFLRTLERLEVLGSKTLRIIRFALVLSLPWYALHSLQWPYSEAASLLLLALACLFLALRSGARRLWFAAISGVLFGAMLNFRSDYIGLPLLIAAVLLLMPAAPWRERVARVAVWVISIGLMMSGWMAYSERATGHVLLTSTNSGHVLFIGLGDLPGNPWHITPVDEDPRMHAELDAHFGSHVSSLTYESDAFLRQRFIALVLEDPMDYAKKVAYDAAGTLVKSDYAGEFYEQDSCQPNCATKYGLAPGARISIRGLLAPLLAQSLSLDGRLRYALVLASKAEGLLVNLGFLASPLVLLLALRRRWVPAAILAIVVGYQWALTSFAILLASYSSTVYLGLLVMGGLFFRYMGELRARRAATRSFENQS
jgi:hypothetical protein